MMMETTSSNTNRGGGGSSSKKQGSRAGKRRRKGGSSSSSTRPEDRRRASVACLECKRGHAKCGFERIDGKCARCARMGLPCTVPTVRRKRGPMSKREREQLKAAEEAFDLSLRQTQHITTTTTAATETAASGGADNIPLVLLLQQQQQQQQQQQLKDSAAQTLLATEFARFRERCVSLQEWRQQQQQQQQQGEEGGIATSSPPPPPPPPPSSQEAEEEGQRSKGRKRVRETEACSCAGQCRTEAAQHVCPTQGTDRETCGLCGIPFIDGVDTGSCVSNSSGESAAPRSPIVLVPPVRDWDLGAEADDVSDDAQRLASCGLPRGMCGCPPATEEPLIKNAWEDGMQQQEEEEEEEEQQGLVGGHDEEEQEQQEGPGDRRVVDTGPSQSRMFGCENCACNHNVGSTCDLFVERHVQQPAAGEAAAMMMMMGSGPVTQQQPAFVTSRPAVQQPYQQSPPPPPPPPPPKQLTANSVAVGMQNIPLNATCGGGGGGGGGCGGACCGGDSMGELETLLLRSGLAPHNTMAATVPGQSSCMLQSAHSSSSSSVSSSSAGSLSLASPPPAPTVQQQQQQYGVHEHQVHHLTPSRPSTTSWEDRHMPH